MHVEGVWNSPAVCGLCWCPKHKKAHSRMEKYLLQDIFNYFLFQTWSVMLPEINIFPKKEKNDTWQRKKKLLVLFSWSLYKISYSVCHKTFWRMWHFQMLRLLWLIKNTFPDLGFLTIYVPRLHFFFIDVLIKISCLKWKQLHERKDEKREEKYDVVWFKSFFLKENRNLKF